MLKNLEIRLRRVPAATTEATSSISNILSQWYRYHFRSIQNLLEEDFATRFVFARFCRTRMTDDLKIRFARKFCLKIIIQYHIIIHNHNLFNLIPNIFLHKYCSGNSVSVRICHFVYILYMELLNAIGLDEYTRHLTE